MLFDMSYAYDFALKFARLFLKDMLMFEFKSSVLP